MLNERKGIEFISHLILNKIEKYKAELGQIYDDIRVLVKYASIEEIKQLNDLSLITGYLDFVKSTASLPKEKNSYYTLEELLDKINGVEVASNSLTEAEPESNIVNRDVRNELEMYEKLMELAMSNNYEITEDSPDDNEYTYDGEYTYNDDNGQEDEDGEDDENEDEDPVDKYADFVYEDEDTNYLEDSDNEDEDPEDYVYDDGEEVVYEDELTDEEEDDEEEFTYEDEETDDGDQGEDDENEDDDNDPDDYDYEDTDNSSEVEDEYEDEEEERDLDEDYSYEDDTDSNEEEEEDTDDNEYEYDSADSDDTWAGWVIAPHLTREQLDNFTEQQIDMLISRGMLVPPEDGEEEDEEGEDYEYEETENKAGVVTDFGTGIPVGQFIGQFDNFAKQEDMVQDKAVKAQVKPVFKDSNVMRTVAMFDKLRKKYDKQQ